MAEGQKKLKGPKSARAETRLMILLCVMVCHRTHLRFSGRGPDRACPSKYRPSPREKQPEHPSLTQLPAPLPAVLLLDGGPFFRSVSIIL